MQINSVENIDMLRIVEKIPKGTHRLRGFTMRAEKKLTNERKYVAAVRLTSGGPLMKFSKPNIEDVVENYTDLAFAVFHELLHVLEGHLDLDRIRSRYRLPDLFEEQQSLRDLEGNEEDLDLEDRRRWKILHFVNELEIKHMEHVLLPDEFHDMNRRLYEEAEKWDPTLQYKEGDRVYVGEERYKANEETTPGTSPPDALGEGPGDGEWDRAQKIPADKRILYRGNEDFGNSLYERLHGRVFSKSRYSPLEAFRVLDRVLPDVPDEPEEQQGQGGGQPDPNADPDDDSGGDGPTIQVSGGEDQKGEGESQAGGDENQDGESGSQNGDGEDGEEGEESSEGEENGEDEGEEEEGSGGEDESGVDVSKNDPLDHTESGVDDDANAEDIQDLVDALKDMADDETEDGAGRDDGDDEGEGDVQQGGGGHTLKPQVAEAKRQAPVNQPRNQEVEEEIKKSGTAPDFHSKVASHVRDEVGKAIQYSTRPNFKHDHRARIRRKHGHFVPKYKQARAPNEEKVALYYDISGSQSEYIPACNEIVLHNKRHLAEQSVFLFSTSVKKMKVSAFSKLAEKGTVQNVLSTYGTDFNAVIRNVRDNEFRKIVVLTDDLSEVDPSLIDPMVRGGQLEHILVVCTIEKEERQKSRSPGFIHSGPEGGYADEVVRVKPVTH